MCGICGFNWEDKEIIKDMTNILSHRGPDQHDFYTDSLISLGHRRLNIIDLSEKGKQPMCNEDGTIWLIYNGEIYNFDEIRSNLENKGHIFKSNTDSEVIIHAYEEYGIECINFFNGMFAFAIWDSIKKRIILVRDRAGIKPLYYHFDKLNNKFIFASEIKSILKNPVIKKEINFKGFNQILHYAFTINGETMFENIFELLPGHFLIYDLNDLIIKKYWEPKTNVQFQSEDFFIQTLQEKLKQAIKKRLVADVPLGASLSGGIDSSAIVAFMSQLTNNPVKTFTIGFNDESDELKEAKKVADFCNTDHHEIMVDFKEITNELPKILWHAESPFARPSMFSGYFLSQGINKNKVIIDLAGSGSDEIFAGYNRYEIYLENSILSNEQKAKKIVSNYFYTEQEKKDFFFEHLLNKMDSNLKPEKIFLSSLNKFGKKEHLNAALEFELKTELQGIQLFRDDRMSMAHSHEIRVPFLDHNIIEFGMTIPSNLKWKGNKKYILQKAVEPFLPREIVYRTKIPFHMPLLRYFQEEFIDVAENILSNSSIIKKRLVKENKIKDQIKKIKNKETTQDNSLRQILFLTNFELFHKIFIEEENINMKI